MTFNNYTTNQQIKVREDQIMNNAGGYVFSIDDMNYLKRFLVLGVETNNYYVTKNQILNEASDRIKNMINTRGREVVDMIVEVSDLGLAPKNDPAVFILALCASDQNVETRRYALSKLEMICRIPTHLYHFLAYVKNRRGWGRTLKRAVAGWFNNKAPKDLAYSLTKYNQRDGFSATDALRLSKPIPTSEEHRVIYNFITYNEKKKNRGIDLLLEKANYFNESASYLKLISRLPSMSEADICEVIEKYGVPYELIPTEKRTALIYQALIKKSGLTWLIRNIRNIDKHKIFDNKLATEQYVSRFSQEAIRKNRVHPINILMGLGYTENQLVNKALNDAFYNAFLNVEKTGKRLYVGVDCSGSMTRPIDMSNISSMQVAACLAMQFLKVEDQPVVKGFGSSMIDLNLHKDDDLNLVMRKMEELDWKMTDCAQPMLDAIKQKLLVDCFIVITDNETYFGKTHPFEALKQYRKWSGIDAKMIVLATSTSDCSIADPSDAGMLDVVGFSSDVFQVINYFLKN
jgi:60 kDa SS-A/Ro ribonucleoprotein